MPRVSDSYLEQRRRQILDAARRCFARQGFYQTSMQDVFAESGLSAGAVYRYFKSKDELVQAIAAGAVGQIGEIIEAALAEDPAPGVDEVAARCAVSVQELAGPDGPTRIAPDAWAAAVHDPAIAAIVSDTLGSLRAQWVRVAQRMTDDGRLPPGTDADAAGSVLFALSPGFLLQYLLLGGTDAAAMRRGLRALLRPEALAPATPDPR